MTTIKPVTIPREVAAAIAALRGAGYDDYAFINAASFDCDIVRLEEGVIRAYAAAGGATTLLSALVNGYERELTEEEAREKAYEGVHQAYRHHKGEAFEDYSDGYCDGIEYTISVLGIEIPGVNVPEEALPNV